MYRLEVSGAVRHIYIYIYIYIYMSLGGKGLKSDKLGSDLACWWSAICCYVGGFSVDRGTVRDWVQGFVCKLQ
jgi:hypothetical protein